jgi:hypothetical protein
MQKTSNTTAQPQGLQFKKVKIENILHFFIGLKKNVYI